MPKVTMDLPDIPGYEYTGEFRPAQTGEAWTIGGNSVYMGCAVGKLFILRQLKPKRHIFEEIPAHEGGGVRYPKAGEWALDAGNGIFRAQTDYEYSRFQILRRIEENA